MNRKTNLSLIVGRFQHIHVGHEKLIKIALETSNRVLVLVSSDEELSANNPYTANYRIGLIERIFYDQIKEGKIIIRSLRTPKEITKYCHIWGRYLLEYSKAIAGVSVDQIVYGDDKNINKCFSNEDLLGIRQLKIERNSLLVSATKMRNILHDGYYDEWRKYSNSLIHNEYDFLKNTIDNYK